MTFSILYLFVLSALSVSARGQTIAFPTECIDAVIAFTQNSACFESPSKQFAFFTEFNSSISGIAPSLAPLHNVALHPGFVSFYNHLCTNQTCVNAMAEVVNICFEPFQDQVGM